MCVVTPPQTRTNNPTRKKHGKTTTQTRKKETQLRDDQEVFHPRKSKPNEVTRHGSPTWAWWQPRESFELAAWVVNDVVRCHSGLDIFTYSTCILLLRWVLVYQVKRFYSPKKNEKKNQEEERNSTMPSRCWDFETVAVVLWMVVFAFIHVAVSLFSSMNVPLLWGFANGL